MHKVYYNALNVFVIKMTGFAIDLSGCVLLTLVPAGLQDRGRREGSMGGTLHLISDADFTLT